MITITKRTTRAIALAAALFAATRLIAPQPAHAVSSGQAAAIGFTVGTDIAVVRVSTGSAKSTA